MIIGHPEYWLKRLSTAEERVIKRVAAVWATCLTKVTSSSSEDAITNNLALRLQEDKQMRRVGRLQTQVPILAEDQAGDVVTKGRIDMALLIGNDPGVYVAFECKRLNARNGTRRVPLSGAYVSEGVARYIRAKYAERLPIGAMIGYVLDGDLRSAETNVRRALLSVSTSVGGSSTIGVLSRFTSHHERASTLEAFELRHTLLPL